MPAEIGSLFVGMNVETGGLASGMGRAERITTASMGRIERKLGVATKASDKFRQSVSTPVRPYAAISAARAFENATNRVGLLRGALLATTAAFGGFTAALASNIITRYADSFTQLNNRLRATSNSTADAAAKFELLQDVATRARSDIASTVTLFSRLTKAQPNRDVNETLRAVETVQKALQLGGATAQEAASAAIQFSQAIASNRLGGEELRAVLETPLGLELAKGLGVTIGRFRELGYEGKLTADVLFGALNTISSGIDKQFANSVPTLENALTRLDSAFIETIGEMNTQYRVTRRLGAAITGLADNLDSILPIVAEAGIVFAGLFGGRLLGRIGQNTVGRLFDNIKSGVAASRGELLDATTAVRKYRTELASLRAAEGRAQQRAGGDVTGFADRGLIKELERSKEEAKKASAEYQKLTDKRVQAQQAVANVTAASSARVVSSVNSIAEAEKRLQTEVARHADLRKQLAGAIRLETMALGQASQVGPTKALAEASKQRLNIEKQLLAAQKNIAVQSEAVVTRRMALDKIEATEKVKQSARIIEAQKRLVTVENAVAQARARSVAATGAIGPLEGRVLASGTRAAQGDVASAAFQRQGAQAGLAAAASRLALARAAATGLGLALTGVLSVSKGLVGFLGGPWGVAFTAAIAIMAKLGIDAEETAARIERAQERTARVLGKLAESGSPAKQAAYEQAVLRQEIKETQDLVKQAQADYAVYREQLRSAVSPLGLELNMPNQQVVGGKGGAFDVSRIGLLGDVNALIDAVREGKKPIEDFGAAFDQIVKARGVTGQVDQLRDLSFEAAKAAADAVELKANLDRLEASKGIASQVDGIKEMRAEMAALRKERTAENAQSGRVNVSANNLRDIELMSETERKVQQLKDQILAEEVKAGNKITEKIAKLAEDRARQIELLQRIGQQSFDISSLTTPITATEQTGNVRSLGGSGSIADAEQAKRIAEMARAVRDLSAVLGEYKLRLAELAEQDIGKLFSAEKAALFAPQIQQAEKALQNLVAQFANGSIKTSTFITKLEKIRDQLKSIGAEGALDGLIDGLINAGFVTDDLRQKLLQLKNSKDTLNSGAFSGRTATAIGSNGRPIDVRVTGGVIEKSLYEMARESRMAREAIEAAADEAAAYDEEAAGQREDILDEQRNTTRGIGFLGTQMGGMRQDFLVSFGKTFGGTPSQNSANAQRQIDMLSAEQSVLQTNLQYRNLTPEQKTAAEYRLAEIAIEIAKLGYQIQTIQYGTGRIGLSGQSTTYTPMPGSTPSPRGFATGGAFKVGGAGGIDSQMVEFMASPNEIVGVYTPQQWEAMMNGGDTEITNVSNHTVVQNIQTPELNAFRQARRQMENDARRGMPG